METGSKTTVPCRRPKAHFSIISTHRMGWSLRTAVSTARGRASPPALCAMAASSQCWLTGSRSPIEPSGALPATRTACSLAEFAARSLSPWFSHLLSLHSHMLLLRTRPSSSCFSQKGNRCSCSRSYHWQISSHLMAFCGAGNISAWV